MCSTLGSEELEDSDENVTSQAALRVVWEWLTLHGGSDQLQRQMSGPEKPIG